MAIGDDFSIAANGDIRYVAGSTDNYTVIAFHRWLGDLMDNAQASGNDLLDITDATASERATDNFITLNTPYNIDDDAAKHLYDGSIVQDTGNTIYDGILCFANAGTYLTIIQNGRIVTPNFWTTALNADSDNGISHRFMLKVRSGGADIDGRRIVGQTREFGFTFSEFKINGTSRGNNVLALTYASDLNNATAEATIEGYTTISNTEGYRLIDVDNDTITEPYYSEWNLDSYSINQMYERTKWLSKRALSESFNTETGTNYIVDNATILGQAQSFLVGANSVLATRAFFNLKIGAGSPTGNMVAKIYAHSGTFGTSSVITGAALAISAPVDSSKLTSSYQPIEFGFTTQALLTAATHYVVSIEHPDGGSSDYVHVEGDATGTHAGNKSTINGPAAQAAEDLWFDVHTSPRLYGLTGELFRGPTHAVVVDGKTGTFSTTEQITWPVSGGADTTAIQLDVSATAMTVTRGSGSFLTNGFLPGMRVRFTDFANAGNNQVKTIAAVTALVMTLENDATLVTETGSGNERGIQVSTGQLLAQVFPETAANQTISVVAAAGTFTRATGSYITDGFRKGMTIVGGSGFSNAGNRAPKIISTVTALVITVTDISGLVNETGDADEDIKSGHLWMQLTSGVIPTDNQTITGQTSGATCLMNITITEKTLSFPYLGASTGSALIGAYGIGVEKADLTASDKLTDLFNILNLPPNNVTFSVAGLRTTFLADRVLVAPLGYSFAFDGESGGPFQIGETLTFAGGETGYLSYLLDNADATGRMQIRLLTGVPPVDNDSISGGTSGATAAVNGTVVESEDPRQLKLLTTLSGGTETAVVCTASIPTDTPSTGTIRIELDTGIFRRVAYTSYSGSTFVIDSTDFSGANTATGGAVEAGNSIFISYIDKAATSTTESFTGVYLADRNLFVRVRNGDSGSLIKTFQTTGTLGSAGGSATSIRTPDA